MNHWTIGLLLSFLYSCILFFVSLKLSKQVIIENSIVSELVLSPNEGIEQSNQRNSSESTKQGLRTLVVLLYTLAVISVGVTGLIIPMNIFYCGSFDNSWDHNNYKWDTNASSLPNDVQTWYNDIIDGSINYNYKDFATLPNSNVLLFSGSNESTGNSLLYKYDGTSVTTYNHFKNPYDFVITSDNSSICIFGYYENPKINDDYIHSTLLSAIACYNKNIDMLRIYHTHDTSNEHEYMDFYDPNYLHPSNNNTLWFIASSYKYHTYNSPAVFSLNDQTMGITLHSNLIEQNEYETKNPISVSCDTDKMIQKRALVSIFTSIMPTLITAIILHKRMKFIPTMSIIIYICITAFIVTLILSVEPTFTKTSLVLKIWLCSSSGIWLNYLVFAFLFDTIVIENDSTIERKKTSHFVWNANFVALLYFFSMSATLGVYS